MNLASALLKQIIALQDVETWSLLRTHYLPIEYQSLHRVIQKHSDTNQKLPTFEELHFEIRDAKTREKLYAVETVETDIEPSILLQYIQNEYVQGLALDSIERYIDNSMSFEDAEETIESLHSIALDVETRAELEHPTESMQYIELFDSDEDLGRLLRLGLNAEFDSEMQFGSDDYILIGGYRGAGKSAVCANIVNNVINTNRTALYFTIEMNTRQTLQRVTSIATGINYVRLRRKNLSLEEWVRVAQWWANRFQDGEEALENYMIHRDFRAFHQNLTSKHPLKKEGRLEIIYDEGLTLSKIKAEVDKATKLNLDCGVVVVDYVNQVKRQAGFSKNGQYDWAEQVEVSKYLKKLAQTYNIPFVVPYQVDKSGEARFSKGILDSADAAYILKPGGDETHPYIEFECTKIRNGPIRSFCSAVDWECLRIGPENGYIETEEGEQANDDPPF